VSKKRKHLFQDAIFFACSIGLAIFMVKTDMAQELITLLGGPRWFEILIAGMFFTSAFTTAPAIVMLGTLAETTPMPLLVILGGLGAMLGDYIIFIFVKDRVSEDLKYLLSFSRGQRFLAIFKTQLFRFFVPFVGALILASPLPDEIGVTMLGLSKMKNKIFLPLSFIFNGAGIFVIGWLAKVIAGL
jgi:hypothetical protein